MKLVNANAQTVLDGAINASQTNLTIVPVGSSPGTLIPQNSRVWIDAEMMIVTARAGGSNQNYTVIRGAEGTTAAAHIDGSIVLYPLVGAGQPRDGIKAAVIYELLARSGGSGGGGGTTSPLTTKGDIWGYDTNDNRIPVGNDGEILVADSTEALGVKWDTPAAGSPGGGGWISLWPGSTFPYGSYSWVNQGSATFTSLSDGTFILYAPISATFPDFHWYQKAAPGASTWELKWGFAPELIDTVNNPMYGLIVTDSTNKGYCWRNQAAVGGNAANGTLVSIRINSMTSESTLLAIQGGWGSALNWFWLGIRITSTLIEFLHGRDPNMMRVFNSESKTAWISSFDKIGPFICADNASFDAYVRVLAEQNF